MRGSPKHYLFILEYITKEAYGIAVCMLKYYCLFCHIKYLNGYAFKSKITSSYGSLDYNHQLNIFT